MYSRYCLVNTDSVQFERYFDQRRLICIPRISHEASKPAKLSPLAQKTKPMKDPPITTSQPVDKESQRDPPMHGIYGSPSVPPCQVCTPLSPKHSHPTTPIHTLAFPPPQGNPYQPLKPSLSLLTITTTSDTTLGGASPPPNTSVGTRGSKPQVLPSVFFAFIFFFAFFSFLFFSAPNHEICFSLTSRRSGRAAVLICSFHWGRPHVREATSEHEELTSGE